MYTGEIITEAIILPDSLSPVKKNPEQVKFLHGFGQGGLDNWEIQFWKVDKSVKSIKKVSQSQSSKLQNQHWQSRAAGRMAGLPALIL